MFSMDIHLRKLVITHFLESLRTLTASIISCLSRMFLPPQYKVYLDPLTAFQPSSSLSPQGRQSGPNPQTPTQMTPRPLHASYMRIATWNVRGAGNARFLLNVQDLINLYRPDILVILEPKIGGQHTEHVIGQVGFPCHFRVDPTGLSEGLLVLWDDRKCNLDVVRAIEQSVAMRIRVTSLTFASSWLFTAIYVSLTLSKRLQLWDHLVSLSSKFNIPWLVMGDFNELLESNDKLGGRPLISSRVQAFNACLSTCGPFDLATSGPTCTWTNKNWDWKRHIRENLNKAF